MTGEGMYLTWQLNIMYPISVANEFLIKAKLAFTNYPH